MSKRTAWSGLGSLATGAVTALALAVQTGLAAVVGVIIAREFGRSAETDGFFAAYAVFLVLALAATAARVTVLPRFARARADDALSAEVVAYAKTASIVIVPLLVVAALAARPIAAVLTGFGPSAARSTAAAALPWMLAAGAGQYAAGLLSSALAALDDYVVPAIGYIAGSIAGLTFIVWRLDADGIQAIAWGMALNAAIATLIPAAALAARARSERVPRTAFRQSDRRIAGRLGELASGAAVPLALQALYLLCLPLAAQSGIGAVTSFGYAYLVGAAVIGVTASSLGLVTSVPLSRMGIDPSSVARHIVASSWIAILAVGATTGVFWLAGEPIVSAILGSGFDSVVGRDLGEVVVAMAPWMVVSIAITLVFPIVFVGTTTRRLPLVALAMIAVQLPLAVVAQRLAGLTGLGAALALSTAVGLVGLLHGLGAVRSTLEGLAAPVLTTAALTAAAFGLAEVVVSSEALAAAVGLVAFVALLVVLRPRGLTEAWRYLRTMA